MVMCCSIFFCGGPARGCLNCYVGKRQGEGWYLLSPRDIGHILFDFLVVVGEHGDALPVRGERVVASIQPRR